GHADDAAADPKDAPRRGAKLEDVAAVGLDRKVFVERADQGAFRLEDDLVVGVVGDSTARSNRGDAGAPSRPDAPTDAVAMPARPTRCKRVAMERDAPIWMTRSTSPMSMPSSSEAVATRTLSSPALSLCSASCRRGADKLPWWQATSLAPRRVPRRAATRSAI